MQFGQASNSIKSNDGTNVTVNKRSLVTDTLFFVNLYK